MEIEEIKDKETVYDFSDFRNSELDLIISDAEIYFENEHYDKWYITEYYKKIIESIKNKESITLSSEDGIILALSEEESLILLDILIEYENKTT